MPPVCLSYIREIFKVNDSQWVLYATCPCFSTIKSYSVTYNWKDINLHLLWWEVVKEKIIVYPQCKIFLDKT